MKSFYLKGLLQNTGWHENVYVTVDDSGIIKNIEQQKINQAIPIEGYAIPAFQNAHSHAFQYAMAGLAEIHAPGKNPDDFWSWRDAMYKLALCINPDQMEAIACMLYTEMLRHGYTQVAEFHYVHHDQNGKPYANLSEMGERLVAAAKKSGIKITLIPIFYQKGGFGKSAEKNQKRFISSHTDAYYKLLDATQKSVGHYEKANIALGAHSLRAVAPENIVDLALNGPQELAFHIHVAEQLKEIESALSFLGKRPVEWLLENMDLSQRFHLVHATHLIEKEINGLAQQGAHVVLCPTTEGNLGDGIFPLRQFQKQGGKWSIGTDSHVSINPLEELRLLDYGQRLISHKRNTFTTEHQGDAGRFAIDMALQSGRKAMGNQSSDYFKVGQPFDAVVYDASAPLLETSGMDKIISTILFSSDAAQHLATIVQGEILVEKSQHIQYEMIKNDFLKAIRAIGNRN